MRESAAKKTWRMKEKAPHSNQVVQEWKLKQGRLDHNKTQSHYPKAQIRPNTRIQRQRRRIYHTDSPPEDDYDYQNQVNWQDVEWSSRKTNSVPFHSRPVGSSHLWLQSIKSTNKNLEKQMTYQSYPFRRTLELRSSLETTEIRVHIKNLRIIM